MSVMLYRHPGKHAMHGDYFDYIIVSEADVDAKVREGWAKSTDEAKSGTAAKPARKSKAKE